MKFVWMKDFKLVSYLIPYHGHYYIEKDYHFPTFFFFFIKRHLSMSEKLLIQNFNLIGANFQALGLSDLKKKITAKNHSYKVLVFTYLHLDLFEIQHQCIAQPCHRVVCPLQSTALCMISLPFSLLFECALILLLQEPGCKL